MSEVVDVVPPKKKKKVWLIILIVILVIILAAVGAAYLYVNHLGLNFRPREDSSQVEDPSRVEDAIYGDADAEDKSTYQGMITAMQSNSSLTGILQDWYNSSGSLMSDSNILNVLIIGVDASGNDPMTGNSDVMMLCSIDKRNQKITLCSFLRDSYTYIKPNGNGYCSKLNAAYAAGGPNALVDAIEHNYKIKIDYYAAVDFDAFVDVINAIGGINLSITPEEAEAIEEYSSTWNDKTVVKSGENVHLNGKQALYFCRMRKIYATGDVQRTENQRRVINAIIQKAKANLSVSLLNSVILTVAPYVSTDMSSTNMISLGTSAVLGKWYNYTVYSMSAPPESARASYNGSQWIWVVDYPFAAQYVQKQIYGETNINIPDGTLSAIDVVNSNGMS